MEIEDVRSLKARPKRFSASDVRKAFASSLRLIDLRHPAIFTLLELTRFGLRITVSTRDRETGSPIGITFTHKLPPPSSLPFLTSEIVIEWIYACIRDAWVHELNEALFVRGKRRRDLHDGKGKTIRPRDLF